MLAGGGRVKPEHLTLEPRRSSVPTMPIERLTPPEAAPSLANAVAEVERQRILDALERCGGNQTRAARMLGGIDIDVVARQLALAQPPIGAAEDRFDLVDGAGAEILGVGGLGNRAEEAGKARLGREIPVRPCNQRRAPVEQRHFVHPSPPELR